MLRLQLRGRGYATFIISILLDIRILEDVLNKNLKHHIFNQNMPHGSRANNKVLWIIFTKLFGHNFATEFS